MSPYTCEVHTHVPPSSIINVIISSAHINVPLTVCTGCKGIENV